MISQPPTNQIISNGSAATFRISASGTGTVNYQWKYNLADFLILSTVAGTGASGHMGDGGPAANATFGNCDAVYADSRGNIYVADGIYSAIRKIDTNGVITTVAGNGTSGSGGDGGKATNALLYLPVDLAVDSKGNIFIADYYNSAIREVLTNGIIINVTSNVIPSTPSGVAVDSAGHVFFTDEGGGDVFEMNTNGTAFRVAGVVIGSTHFRGYSGDGGPATNAMLSSPEDLKVDAAGNLYIADSVDNCVRKIDSHGIITTVIGTGIAGYSGDGYAATNATLNAPQGLALDNSGNLFVADRGNARIRKVDTNGLITTVAGDAMAGFYGNGGPSTAASLNGPSGVSADGRGNLYIADASNHRMRMAAAAASSNMIALSISNATTNNLGDYSVVVSDATGSVTSAPATLYMTPFFVQQPQSQSVWVGAAATFNETAAGTTPLGYQWSFNGTNIDGATNASFTASNITISDSGTYQVTATNAFLPVLSTAALLTADYIIQAPANEGVTNGGKAALSVSAFGGPYTYQWQFKGTNLPVIGTISTAAGTGTNGNSGDQGPAVHANLSSPYGACLDSAGNLYLADYGNSTVRKVDPGGTITRFAGTGTSGFSGDGLAATHSQLFNPASVAVDQVGNLFIADLNNCRIRKVTTNGILATVAGNGTAGFAGDSGPATNAALSYPAGVAIDGLGNIYIADTQNNRIRRVDTNGIIQTVAGTGVAAFTGDGGLAINAALRMPTGLAVDAAGSVFVGDSGNVRVRAISTNGIITTVAGNKNSGHTGDGGAATNATLLDPYSVSLDGAGNLFIADLGGYIREVATNGLITTLAGGGAANPGDGGTATNALLSPRAVAVDPGGAIFVADSGNYRIRKVTAAHPNILPVLTLNGISSSNLGNYSVVITGAGGSYTSSVASLSLLLPPQAFTGTNVGNGFKLQFTGSTNYPYILQSAISLTPPINWQPVATNPSDAGGNWQFTDTNLDAHQKLYRILGL